MKDYTLEKQLDIIRSHQKTAPVRVTPIALDLGVRVFKVMDSMPDNISGMIKKFGNKKGDFAIYFNGRHHDHRRRFTIAHELAHLILHKDLIGDGIVDDALYRSGLSNAIEAQANRLAAKILMPRHLLETYFMENIKRPDDLARIFEVSETAMSIRLNFYGWSGV